MGRVRTIQVGMGWQPEEAGGLNRMFFELAGRLPGEGVDVRGLVAGSSEVERQSRGAVRAFAAAQAPMWRRLAGVRRAARAALREMPDAVVVSHFAPYGIGVLGAVGTRPFVSYFHGPWAEESRVEGRGRLSTRVRHALERRVYTRSHACIALSRAFARVLAGDYGVDERRIQVIPGGVDVARFGALPPRDEARRRLGWTADVPTVLAVRRLVWRTGMDRLIAAVPALRARVPNVRVLIAGEGPTRDALEADARALGVGDAVRFLGFVPEEQLPLAYRAADVTVVPSVALEGFGLIVPESLAAGTPVMVTPVGGLPETVEGLSTELVLREATPEAIAAGLARAFAEPGTLPDAARCARFARERYDWPVIARAVAAFLEQVGKDRRA